MLVHFFGRSRLSSPVPWAPLESRECCVAPERLLWRLDVCARGRASTNKYESSAFKMRRIRRLAAQWSPSDAAL